MPCAIDQPFTGILGPTHTCPIALPAPQILVKTRTVIRVTTVLHLHCTLYTFDNAHVHVCNVMSIDYYLFALDLALDGVYCN